MRRCSSLALLCLLACDGKSSDTGGSGADADADGFAEDVDCDDADGAIYPGADELCDGVDNDCDGRIDDDPVDGTMYFADADADGFGADVYTVLACDVPTGFAARGGDCDDARSGDNPDADEACDGRDNNCDGAIDEGVDASEMATFYTDSDGDGLGDPDQGEASCVTPAGAVANGDDCDDGDADVGVGSTWYADVDGDGYGADAYTEDACDQPSGFVLNAGDCDDLDGGNYPGADEVCDGADNNCDGDVDEDSAVDAQGYYDDVDGDGWGDETSAAFACEPPASAVLVGGDCDDVDADVYPWAVEVCDDGVDQDCNGHVDNTCDVSLTTASADVRFEGEGTYDYFGNGLVAGDADGDGVLDIAVGAYGEDSNGSAAGKVYVLAGPLSAGSDVGDAVATYLGADGGDNLGSSVTMLSDQDGDGTQELVMAAYGQDDGGTLAGQVYVHYGPLSGQDIDVTTGDAVLTGSVSSGSFGRWTLLDGGDLTGDGTADLVVGAYAEYSFTGAVYGFAGPVSGEISASDATFSVIGTDQGSYLGYDASAVDADGDGISDLLVGTPGVDSGAVCLMQGPLTGTLDPVSDCASQYVGDADGDWMGSLIGAGDVNGDGYADLMAGAKYTSTVESKAGAVYVFHGPLTAGGTASDAAFSLMGSEAGYYLGHQEGDLSSGDVDGDGHDDLLLGWIYASYSGSTSGASFLVYGPMSGSHDVSQVDRSFVGDDVSYRAGQVALLEDLDGDGLDDVLMGGRYGTDNYGAVDLFWASGL